MFLRRFAPIIGIVGLAILFIAFWSHETNQEKVAIPHAPLVSNQAGSDSGADKTLRRKKESQKKITDVKKLELAHGSVVDAKFPTKIEEAGTKLKQDLKYLYSLPPSNERRLLLTFLIEAYSQEAFQISSSNEELLDRMQRFGDIIKKFAASADVEKLLISASEKCAKMIGALPAQDGDALRNYFESQGAIGDTQMGARIAASCYVEILNSSEAPNGSLIDGISNLYVRTLVERTFLRTFDFGRAPEKVVETFAMRYLDPASNVNSDHQIAVGLFGLGLQKYPQAISTVILNTPPSKKKDEAIEQMIFRISPNDHEMASLWWQQIQDPEIKKRAEIDIAGKRLRGKPMPAADPDANPADDPFQ